MLSYLRPNFSKSPLNFAFLFLVLLGSFSFASIVSAEPTYYKINNVAGWTVPELCDSVAASYGGTTTASPDPNNARCFLYTDGSYWKALWYQAEDCAVNHHAICDNPPVTEPENCQELADQNPDKFSMSLPGGFTMTACRSGCKAVSAGGVGLELGDGSYYGDFYYTSSPCSGGFDPAAGDVTDVMDVYELDDELQNCYTPDGVLIGRVGIGMSCPEDVYACYDSAGTFTGTAPGGSACTVGSKNFSSERPLSETSSTQKVCDAAGNCTTTTETNKTETGADGSKTSTTTKKVTTCTSTGECTTVETTEEGACTGEDCATADKAANGYDQCVNKPICGGDVLACESLFLQWEAKCSAPDLSSTSLTDYLASETGPGAGVGTDELGQLDGIDAGEIDIADSWDFSSIFADSGRNGSCPADRSTVFDQSFSFQPICDVASQLRYLVLFSAVFMSMVMIRKSIFGG